MKNDPNHFSALGLCPELAEAVGVLGFENPTPIQQNAIPELLGGRDIVAQAQTGTGKTAAFGLPLLQRVDPSERAVQALVLAPTRELAMQVGEALESYAQKIRGLRVLTVYGGAPIHHQLHALRRGVHVVVGTPGRVGDCIRRGALVLGDVRFVALDEADEMLQMGFVEDVETILAETPDTRQTALFSATMPPAVRRVADSYLDDPVNVRTVGETRGVAETAQNVIYAYTNWKVDALARVLEVEDMNAALVFARTRAGCRELAGSLEARGYATMALHGDLSQNEREDVVARLRAGRVNLVVATDVAARGLDVECISHVVNFDPPQNPEIYLHRIGRTGRAGRKGVSILILHPREHYKQRSLERFTGQDMAEMQVPTDADIGRSRARRLARAAGQVLETNDIAAYRPIVEAMIAEHDGDAVAVAAALAHLCARDRPIHAENPMADQGAGRRDERPEREHRSERGSNGVRRHGPPTPRAAQRPAPDARRGPPRRWDEGERARLFLSVGAHAGVRPGDIVGAIANETGLAGREIGPIEIRDRHSFVHVPAEQAESVIARMSEASIRGRRARFTVARPSRPQAQRHPRSRRN